MKSWILDIVWRVLQHVLPTRSYLKLKYWVVFKKKINLESPQTFNEKMQWLKLYGCRPEYSKMVDKVLVKDYLKEKIGEEYVIPVFGVWDSPAKIDFNSLPKKFVLKCNHDSGQVVICKDKDSLDTNDARKMMSRSLRHNYYLMGRETPYKNVERKILAEAYLESQDGELKDYKVHNFNGEPRMILVCQDRFSETGLTEDFYSAEWKHFNLKRPDHPNSRQLDERPELLDEMLRISRILSKDIPFLRTDFYIVDHRLYVGELTFYPSSGFVPFVPDEWDYKLGEWLSIPMKVD